MRSVARVAAVLCVLVFAAIPAFSAESLSAAETAYDTGAYPIDIAYHPTLPLVVAAGTERYGIYDRSRGSEYGQYLKRSTEGLKQIKRVWFTPDGTHVAILAETSKNKRNLRIQPLLLTRINSLLQDDLRILGR